MQQELLALLIETAQQREHTSHSCTTSIVYSPVHEFKRFVPSNNLNNMVNTSLQIQEYEGFKNA
jgi:hypothetical protein